MKWLKTAVPTLLPPITVFGLFLTVWQLVVMIGDFERYLLPGPVAVGQAAVRKWAELGGALALTAAAALLGFFASLVFGTLIAFAFASSRLVRASCYPYAIFFQTVPIVAIAPLIVVCVGYGFRSVALIAFIISLFPIITNATTGLTAVDRDLLDLFRLHNASYWQTLVKLRLPNAVPFLVTGARISCGLAVVGAIVGEFFAGFGSSRRGLGYLINESIERFSTDQLFAVVIASSALGTTIFAIVNWVGTTILARWYHA
jgi:NitT/TauT family transport system permease protein